MSTPIKVIKADGTIQPFSEQKVIGSLKRAGADLSTAQRIVEQIKPSLYQFIPSFEVYQQIMTLLKKQKQKSLAERYDLKRAIMELGPTGYPFEKFFAEVLRLSGYQVQTNRTITGCCVNHEIDVVASKNKEKYMVECKFHNQPGTRTDIKVALYVWARFLDVKKNGFTLPWLVTNTKITQEVKTYARCMKMKVTAWDYPDEESLRTLIDSSGLHPITSVAKLDLDQKQTLINQGVIFCKDFQDCQLAARNGLG